MNAIQFKKKMPTGIEIMHMNAGERANLEKGMDLAITVFQKMKGQLATIALNNKDKRFDVNTARAIINARQRECERVLKDIEGANNDHFCNERSKGE